MIRPSPPSSPLWKKDGEDAKRQKFGEMAAKDLSKVFFETISKTVIIDTLPQIQKHIRKNTIISFRRKASGGWIPKDLHR